MTCRVLTVVMLLGLFMVPRVMAQDDSDEDMLQTLPNPEELVSMISPGDRWITYVPLEDVARALGSTLRYDASRRHYSVQSSEEGVLKVRGGEATERIDRSVGALHNPRRPGVASVSRATSFNIDGHVVSKGIILVDGQPYMPLDDLTASMGVVVEERPSPDGGMERVFVRQEGVTPLLGPSERGVIIGPRPPMPGWNGRPPDTATPASTP